MTQATDTRVYALSAKQAIDRRLATILEEKVRAAQALDPEYGRLITAIATLIKRGGKRLRPTLTLLAYEGFGGQGRAKILPVAASQELFHAFILMHDDIIDRDNVRWGGPNIIGNYFESFSRSLPAREALHFAEAWSLMAGDICLNMSQEILLGSDFGPELLLRASGLQHQTLFQMIGGEVLDVAMSLEDLAASEEQLLSICRYKTAAYSFRLPLQLGALLAGADAAALRRIEHFAFDLGIAFQLRDDLLGLFGDESKTGKSSLSDLREGKRTLLVTYGLRNATSADQKILRGFLGDPDVSAENLKTARQILTGSGARRQTETIAQNYLDKALASLPGLGLNPKAAGILTQLTASTLRRKK